jgi:hypothetical protein
MLTPLERLLFWIPRQQPYQDDLRDQWQSYAHLAEWQRLVQVLLDFSEHSQTPVTILSGEIHFAAFGLLERRQTQIFQLTSSGIVHPAPPQLAARILDWCGRRTRAITADSHMQMLPLPLVGSRYLAARNWLTLASGPDAAIEVAWHAEGIDEALRTHLPSSQDAPSFSA